MGKPITLAYCIPSLYQFGGMERVLTQKANYLASKNDYIVHIIVTDGKDKAPCFKLNPSITVHNLDINFDQMYQYGTLQRILVYRHKMISLKEKLNDCLCRIKPDITVSMLRRDINVIDKMTDGSRKVGEIHVDKLHFRKFYFKYFPSFVNNIISNMWMKELTNKVKKLDAFVTLTHEDAEQWSELTNIHVIPNPVNELPNKYSDCINKQVIAVGRLCEQKGFDILLNSWSIVVDKHPDWTLKIYGDGEMREMLTARVDELGIKNNCILEHFSTDIYEKYRQSSIFVLSSRFEGFGLVLVEAMSCGIPVVSFSCPCGPRDIISINKDGLLVESGNEKELAEKISWLIEHDEDRIEMGKNAINKSKKYDIDIIGKQWESLFENLMKN